MHPLPTFRLAAATLAIEASVGYPRVLFRLIDRPLTWVAALIGTTEIRREGCYDPVLNGRAANEPFLAGLDAKGLEVTLARLGRAPRADQIATLRSSQVEA